MVGWLGYLRVCVIVWLTQIILQLENLECGNKNIRVWGSYLLAFICRSPTWSPQIVGPQYKRHTQTAKWNGWEISWRMESDWLCVCYRAKRQAKPSSVGTARSNIVILTRSIYWPATRARLAGTHSYTHSKVVGYKRRNVYGSNDDGL